LDVAGGSKFRELNLADRLDLIKKHASLEDRNIQFLKDSTHILGFDNVNRMIENAIGVFPIPMGIATNFLINDIDYLIPMAIEEPSVIAATSKAAKLAKLTGGFRAEADDSLMVGQIQVIPDDKPCEGISK
jgi:hydroxymethylglutaryl-CoA reductase